MGSIDAICVPPFLMLIFGFSIIVSGTFFFIKLIAEMRQISFNVVDQYLGSLHPITMISLVLFSGAGLQNPIGTNKWIHLFLACILTIASISLFSILKIDIGNVFVIVAIFILLLVLTIAFRIIIKFLLYLEK